MHRLLPLLLPWLLWTSCGGSHSYTPAPESARTEANGSARTAGGGPGYRNQDLFMEHYAKHGREFGNITPNQFLALAQQLRDAPVGGDILEARTDSGTFSRFDRKTGAFGAYNPDGTIRTFFKPGAGESYFRRQAERRGER